MACRNSILDPCNGGFAKILAYNIFTTKLKVQDTGTTKLEHQFQFKCGSFLDFITIYGL